ncbi:MAG: ArsA family ATPase [Actinomycetota bacterium]|nr:ArsA family ATPase [Actinomycetota bacterium]
MRILLFTGKGGVGKTTAAAATALRLAGRGHKTLIISADPAHSLADALGGGPIGDRPSEVAPGLMACQIDGLDRMQQHWTGEAGWAAITERLSVAAPASGLDPIVAEELAMLPGLDELMAILTLEEEVATGLYDAVVVDCAPTGQTLRLLALPDVLDRYLERLYPVHQRMLRSIGLLGPGGLSPTRGGEALALVVSRLHERLVVLRKLLTDPEVTRIRLVVTAESLALAEARRAATALALFGYTVDGVIVNRVVDDGALDVAGMPAWLQAWAGAQRRVLADVESSFPGLPIRVIQHRGEEPVGATLLDGVADELYEGPSEGIDPLAGPEPPDLLRVVAEGGDYLLRLAMPHVRSAEVRLNRVGDELAVSVEGHRRLLALPGLLTRCRIIDAVLADGVLTVRFEPDPERWPEELLRAHREQA